MAEYFWFGVWYPCPPFQQWAPRTIAHWMRERQMFCNIFLSACSHSRSEYLTIWSGCRHWPRTNHHCISKRILLHWKFWRGQASDEVCFAVLSIVTVLMLCLKHCRDFAKTIKRPFGLRYNPYTQTVELLTNTRKIANIVSELKGDLCIVTNALSKLKVSEPEPLNR